LTELGTVVAALGEAGFALDPSSARPVGGGCIHAATRLDGADGPLFLKTCPAASGWQLEAEADGLAGLHEAGFLRVPAVLAGGTANSTSWLALEWLELRSPTARSDAALGAALAQQHLASGDSFGWRRDNAIGATPQPNARGADWARFFATQRIGAQAEMGARAGWPPSLVAQARRLLDLCVALNTIHDPDALLQLIIETATDILDCEAASLLLYDEATGRLRFEAATGQHADALAEIFVPLDRSIAGTIFRENRTLLIEDADRDERHFKGASEATGLHTQVLLGVPMRIEGAPVGVLEALNPRRGAFSEADIETLSIVSAQAAVAIRNARQRQALRTANDRLARLDQLKNDFMAVASHELRTPVSIVLGFGTVLRDESDGHLAVMAADVMAAGKRMQEIIETVEEMSAIQAESIKLERHPVEIQQVLRETWTHVGVEAEIEHTRIDLPDAPLWVHGDHRRLLLVFEALLKNACTFTPRSGSVELTLTRRESDLFVTLCDTGCGLAEADLHRIFEAFYQADAPLTRPHDGLGVGLTMAETLARLHDGHIWAESDGRDRGSTFHVRLPLYQP